MKNTIEGFNQKNAICIGLKSDDLLVLRWLVDFSHSPKMKKKMIGKDVYYWVDYQAILKDLPILQIGKYQLQRKIFKRLVDTKVLKHRRVTKSGHGGGTYSYYAFGESYDLLICDDTDRKEKSENQPKGNDPCNETVTPPVGNASHQRPCNYSNPSSKQVTMQQRDKDVPLPTMCGHKNGVTDGTADSGQQKAELETFSPQLEQFVSLTYPALFAEYQGYQHPRLKPYQRYRTLQILRDYLHDYDEDIEALEAAAEEFVSDGESDGNILAFANPDVIEYRLVRQGF